MKITFERSGGIVGMRITANIDTAQLEADDAQVVHDLVDAADFFNLPQKLEADERLYDSFNYKVSIESGDQHNTVEANEGALPDNVRLLMRKLSVLAR